MSKAYQYVTTNDMIYFNMKDFLKRNTIIFVKHYHLNLKVLKRLAINGTLHVLRAVCENEN
jgi:hypothetical protein